MTTGLRCGYCRTQARAGDDVDLGDKCRASITVQSDLAAGNQQFQCPGSFGIPYFEPVAATPIPQLASATPTLAQQASVTTH